ARFPPRGARLVRTTRGSHPPPPRRSRPSCRPPTPPSPSEMSRALRSSRSRIVLVRRKESPAQNRLEPGQREVRRVPRLHQVGFGLAEAYFGLQQIENRRRAGPVPALLHPEVFP